MDKWKEVLERFWADETDNKFMVTIICVALIIGAFIITYGYGVIMYGI